MSRRPARPPGESWPDATQELLVRAAVLGGGEGMSAWEQWRRRVPLDDIDWTSLRMIPTVFRNLEAHGYDGPDIGRLKGIYLKSWSRNHLLFESAGTALAALARAGAETMVLKGAGLAATQYRDPGARWMDDIDILVRPADAGRAYDALTAAGWRAHEGRPEPLMPIKQASAYENAAGQLIDLHWHALWQPAPDDDFRSASVPIEIGGAETTALCATDQVLHICVHGCTWKPTTRHDWLVDAAITIRRAAGELDWDRLVERSIARRATICLADSLEFLRDRLDIEVPATVTERLREARSPLFERLGARATRRPPTPVRKLAVEWDRYRRYDALDVPGPRSPSFVSYLQTAIGTERRTELAFRGVKRFLGIKSGPRSRPRENQGQHPGPTGTGPHVRRARGRQNV